MTGYLMDNWLIFQYSSCCDGETEKRKHRPMTEYRVKVRRYISYRQIRKRCRKTIVHRALGQGDSVPKHVPKKILSASGKDDPYRKPTQVGK